MALDRSSWTHASALRVQWCRLASKGFKLSLHSVSFVELSIFLGAPSGDLQGLLPGCQLHL